MAVVSGLASPGAPSTPALVSPYVAIANSYLSGLAAPDLSSQVTGPTTVWMYDGQEWRPASYIHNHDRAYAPIARGVTNGDFHNHGSGDGAPIHYATLLGLPTIPDTPAGVGLDAVTNDAQVKRSELGMPGGVATLDGNGLVAQEPTSATSTPGALKIVKTGVSGLLDAWISAASTAIKGLVQLATAAEAKAGTVDDKAVTPAGLAASAKGLINAYTTIYVRTDGNDANDGTANDAAHAKQTIPGTLASIAGKLIAPGVTVTIQVADGTYSVPATIALDHPDGDKISLLGNTSAETSVPIASINATMKTVTVAGNYTGSLQAGDIFGLLGSSASALNGAYVASSVAFDGTNTVITCAAENFASEMVGGGNILIKPCNRCVLNLATYGFNITTKVKSINGFRFNGQGGTVNKAVFSSQSGAYGSVANCIANNTGSGFSASFMSTLQMNGCISKQCYIGIQALSVGGVTVSGNKTILDSGTFGVSAYGMSFVGYTTNIVTRNNTTNFSPAVGTAGSGNSFIL